MPELFATHAREHPSRDAVVDEHGALTYAALDERGYNQNTITLRSAAPERDEATASLIRSSG